MRIVLYLSATADMDLIAQVQTWPLGTRSQRIKQAWRSGLAGEKGRVDADTRLAGLEQRLAALESDTPSPVPRPKVAPPQGWGADAMQGLLSGLASDDETSEDPR